MMNDMERPLPAGWKFPTVREVLEVHYGKGLIKSNRDESGNIPVYGSSGLVGYHTKALIDGPCIIIGRKGSAGAVHLSLNSCWPIDTTYYIQPPNGISLKYAFYSLGFLNLVKLDRSTAIPGLNRDDLYSQHFPLAPMEEQERIVAEIEKQFSRLDTAVATLQRLQATLTRYKTAVLKAACEGRLVPQDPSDETAVDLLERILAERRTRWQTANPRKPYPEPELIENSNFSKLNEQWTWVSLELLASPQRHSISSGPFGSALGTKDYYPFGVPVIRGRNIKPMEFDINNLVYINEEKATDLIRSTAKPDDLIIVAVGSSGQSALVPDDLPKAILSQNCNKITLDKNLVEPKYILIAMQVNTTKKQLTEITTDTVRKFLSLTNLKRTLLPIPPLPEQRRIVEEVERRLSVVGAVEKSVQANLTRAERLRQAILHRAFTGQLLPR